MFKLPIDFFFMLLYSQNIWGRSEAGLSRWPVTPEIAGSSPVAPDMSCQNILSALFFWSQQGSASDYFGTLIIYIGCLIVLLNCEMPSSGSSAGVARLVRD